MLFQAPRGTVDILPDQQGYWRFLESRAQELAERFGYERIDTPIFEDARLFVRGVGEVTDIVEKETYTFEDRGGDLVTLRPEGTAPVCRSYLEHGLHNLPQPVRLYYLCPVFRYERPQSGRFRQHHQFGIEVFGDGDASVDVEVIELGWRFLESAGLKDLSLSVNSIGDSECRPDYIGTLSSYYREREDALHADCKRRLESNPLRLLDCKEDSCQPIIAGAPHSVDHLCGACQQHWSALLTYLVEAGLPHEIDHRLVRGFDYYTRTVFEIVPPVEGRMATVLGGGRYDSLIQELGGRPTPGVGFGMGIERVIENMKRQGADPPDRVSTRILVAHVGDTAKAEAMRLCARLRREGTSAVLGPSERGLRSQLRYASSIKATHAVIIGEDEIEKGVVTLRDLAESKQEQITQNELLKLFAERT